MDMVIFLPESEEWRNITDQAVPGIKPYYMVSNHGRVYSNFINRIMLETTNNSGYQTVILSTTNGPKIQLVHRLVLMTFGYIEGCNILDVNHKNTCKGHNWVWNLEWNTRKENMAHAYENNLCKLGEDSNSGKLTNNEVIKICGMLQEGIPINDICLSINNESSKNIKAVIYSILEGVAWQHISKDYNFAKYNKGAFSDCQVKEICGYLQCNSKINYKEIMELLDFDTYLMDNKTFRRYQCAISNIKLRKTFTHISKYYVF